MNYVKSREGSHFDPNRTKKHRGKYSVPNNEEYFNNNNYYEENDTFMLRLINLAGDEFNIELDLPEKIRFISKINGNTDPLTAFMIYIGNHNRNEMLKQVNEEGYKQFLPSGITKRILSQALEKNKDFEDKHTNAKATINSILLSPNNFYYS